MSDSKVFMFPENGYNNDGFGLGGWGGGVLGFILGILLGNGGLFGNNLGNAGLNGVAAQIAGNNNTDLIMNAISGTDADVRQLATTLNSDINEVSNAVHAVQSAIQQVGAQNGMGFLQVVNALQSGNAAIASQLSQCCCENRLLTTQQGYEARIQTIEQTNQLGSQADRNAKSIADAIAAQTTLITKEFCEVKERELQNKIDSLTAQNTQLVDKINETAQTAVFMQKFAELQSEIAAIKAAQPATITLPNNSWTAVPTLLATAGADLVSSYWANRLSQATTSSTTTPATA